MRDNWCVGFSDRYTVGVWMGNASGDPMHDVSGVTGAAPVWQAIMNHLHENSPGRAPAPPKSVSFQDVRFKPEVEPARREAFIRGTQMNLVSLPEDSIAMPRILGPGNGAMLAWDPDIPAERQIVRFVARPWVPGLHWQMDDSPLSVQAGNSLSWQPVPGNHTLQLLDAQGKVADEMKLTVRGAPRQVKAEINL